MKNFIVLDCPWCFAQLMTMPVQAKSNTKCDLGIVYAQCRSCTMPTTAVLRKTREFIYSTFRDWVANAEGDVVQACGAQVELVVPEQNKTNAPAHVPPNTVRVYIQAQNARQRQELDTAGMAFRKTLDIALKAFAPNLEGLLSIRIKKLAEDQIITKAMEEWANQVRLIGNEANHEEEEPTRGDIDAIADYRNFAEVLIYPSHGS